MLIKANCTFSGLGTEGSSTGRENKHKTETIGLQQSRVRGRLEEEIRLLPS